MTARLRQSSIRKVLTQNAVNVALAFGSVISTGDVISLDISTTPANVGFGNIVRIEVGGADIYIGFGDSSILAVTSTTSPALKLKANSITNVIATGDYLRASANATRVELFVL